VGSAKGGEQSLVAELPAGSYDFKSVKNQQTKFTIHITDSSGAPVIGGAGDLKVVINGPDKISASVVDNFNGEYTISFKATISGEYRISAYYKAQLVQGRAFVCLVEDSDDISSGGPVKVTVEFEGRDQNGKLFSGAEKFTAQVKNPEGRLVNYVIKEQASGSGKYYLTFDAEKRGEYTVVIYLGSYTVSRQVFNPFDNASSGSGSGTGTGSSSGARGTGDSLKSATAAASKEEGSVICEWSFAVQVLNAAGLPDVHDRSEFKIHVEGPDPSLQVLVKEKGNGKYKITYKPRIHGEYAVHVTLRGNPIKGSPFRQSF